MGDQEDRQRRITRRALLVLAHDLPCLRRGAMELYGGGEGIEGLHRRLHSDSTVARESPFNHLWPLSMKIDLWTVSLVYTFSKT